MRRRLGRPGRDLRRRAAPGAARKVAAAALNGLDIFDLAGLRARVAAAIGAVDAPDRHGLTGGSSAAKTLARVVSPFEVALLDLQGQAIGRPVHDAARRQGARPRAVLRVPVLQVGRPSRRRAGRVGRGARPGRHRRPGPQMIDRVRLRLDQAQGRRVPAGRGDRRDPGAARGVPGPSAAARPERRLDGRRPRSRWPSRPTGCWSTWRTRPAAWPGWPRWPRSPRCRWPPTCAWSRSPTCPRRSGAARSGSCSPTTTTGAGCAPRPTSPRICRTWGLGLSRCTPTATSGSAWRR